MAFTQDTFSIVGAASSAAPTVYCYSTADTIIVVTTSGYFTPKQNQLVEGDLIHACAVDEDTTLVVNSDTSTATESAVATQNNVKILNF